MGVLLELLAILPINRLWDVHFGFISSTLAHHLINYSVRSLKGLPNSVHESATAETSKEFVTQRYWPGSIFNNALPVTQDRKTARVTHAEAQSSGRFETPAVQAHNRPEARRSGELPRPA